MICRNIRLEPGQIKDNPYISELRSFYESIAQISVKSVCTNRLLGIEHRAHYRYVFGGKLTRISWLAVPPFHSRHRLLGYQVYPLLVQSP